MSGTRSRCAWAAGPRATAAMVEYHDTEWGVPSVREVHLFEMLTLESAQAGLSWSTVLAKREGYRQCFAGFDPEAVAAFSPDEIDGLVASGPIVRNRAKVEATVANARVIRAMHEEGDSLAALLWSGRGEPVANAWHEPSEVPTTTAVAKELAAAMKRAGLRFVGPTICYSLMQAVGIVNDHLVSCYRWSDLAAAQSSAPSRS